MAAGNSPHHPRRLTSWAVAPLVLGLALAFWLVTALAAGVPAIVSTWPALAATESYRATFGTHNTPTSTYAGNVYDVSVAATNSGTATWRRSGTGRVALSYHWLDTAGREVQVSQLQTVPDTDVPPGGDTTFTARLRAPAIAGDYTVRWDMVKPGVIGIAAWFSAAGSSTLEVPVRNDSDFAAEYRGYRAPSQVFAYTAHDATLVVANTSLMTWGFSSWPFGLAYGWTSGGEVTPSLLRTTYLPREVAAGGETTVPVRFYGPSRDGTQVVRWDLFQRGVARFSDRGVPTYDVTYAVRYDHKVAYRSPIVPSEMYADATYPVSAVLKNTSRMAWPKGRTIVFKPYWRTAAGAAVGPRQRSIPIPRYLAPGGTVRVRTVVAPPRARGTFFLYFDLAHPGHGWFSRLGGLGAKPLRREVRVKRFTQWVYYHGDRRRKEIALTFDDGGNFNHRILSITERYKVPATAFLLGGLVSGLKPEIARMKAGGWEIANHTWDHRQMTLLSDTQLSWEVRKTASVLDPVVGRRYPFVRPPYGSVNDRNIALLKGMGYRVIMWDVDPRDWDSGISPSQKLSTILSTTRPGSIILMHFGGKGTADILPTVITTLKARGYTFRKLSDILY